MCIEFPWKGGSISRRSTPCFRSTHLKMTAQSEGITVGRTSLVLAQRIEDLLTRPSCRPDQRILIALAGVPGSGKSTVTDLLTKALQQRAIEHVAVVPMVGSLGF